MYTTPINSANSISMKRKIVCRFLVLICVRCPYVCIGYTYTECKCEWNALNQIAGRKLSVKQKERKKKWKTKSQKKNEKQTVKILWQVARRAQIYTPTKTACAGDHMSVRARHPNNNTYRQSSCESTKKDVHIAPAASRYLVVRKMCTTAQ